MKSILVIDTPVSCSTCNQRHGINCGAAEYREIALEEGVRKLASFCPLKIVPDGIAKQITDAINDVASSEVTKMRIEYDMFREEDLLKGFSQ